MSNTPTNLKKLLEATVQASINEIKDEIKLHQLIASKSNLYMLPCKYFIPKYTASWIMRKSRSDIERIFFEMSLVCLPTSNDQSDVVTSLLMT